MQMQAKPPTVTTYDQVIENVRNFNAGLSEETGIETLLAYFRAWYFLPEEDAVGPSKFIGYEGMNGIEYMLRSDLDGKESEPAMQRWFETLAEGTPEYKYVEQKTWELAARFGKRVNRVARYGAPVGWRVSSRDHLANKSQIGSGIPTPPLNAVGGRDESSAIVEVFARAFSTLRPSEQAELRNLIVGMSP